MNERLANFFNYLVWVFYEYKKLSDPNSNQGQFKIIEAKTCKKTGQTLFTIQLFGKNVFPIFTARELAEDKEVLLKFSKADVITIIEAAKSDELKIRRAEESTIDSVTFDRSNKTRVFSFSIKQGETTEIKSYTATEVYSNKEFLLNLDKNSVADVSYEAGKESTEL